MSDRQHPTRVSDGATTATRVKGTGLDDAPLGPSALPARFFVSDRLAPRRRRASDVVRLVLSFGIFTLLGWIAAKDPGVDTRVLAVFDDLPGWTQSIAWLAFSLASLVTLIIVVVAVVRAGRGRGLVRDLAVSLVIAAGVGLLASWLTGAGFPDLLPEVFDPTGRPPFPTLRITSVVVVNLVLSPYVTTTVRRTLGWATAAILVAPFLVGLASVTSWCGAIALSIGSVAAVRLAYGTPEGLPSVTRLSDVLARAGTTVTGLTYRAEQPGTVGLATAIATDGAQLDIKIYGAEAANQQRAERVWHALWYHSAGPAPSAGRNEQAQHEALALMTASAHDVNVPTVRAAGRTVDGDVLLVTAGIDGTRLDQTEGPVTGDELARMWSTLVALHRDARITHGRIDETSVRLTDDGAQLTNFAHAALLPTRQQLATDIVSMLALQAITTDVDAALDAAASSVSTVDLTACLPYVQDAVVTPHLRSRLRHNHIKMKQLRVGLAERLGVEAPTLAPVRRVRVQDLIVAVVAIIAANTLIGQIADIGLGNLANSVAAASAGWFVVAFGIKFVGYVNGAFEVRTLIDRPLPMLPTTVLQSAKGFVGLAVPDVAGQNGPDLRYLQKQGVPLSVAATQGPIKSVIGFVAKVVLLIWSSWAVGQTIDTSTVQSSGGGTLIGLAIIAVIVGAVIVAAIPKWRKTAINAVKELLKSVKHILSSPRTLFAVLANEIIGILLSALSLTAVVVAFGADVSFPALVFVLIGTSFLAGLTPVPSGIGVAEATMSGLLTTIGLPADLSVTVAITYRMLTSYLPPVLGFVSLRWLTKHGYL